MPKAIRYHEQALAIRREIGDKLGEEIVLGNLAIAYKKLGSVSKAILYYEQALALSREIGHRQGSGNDLANLGLLYKDLGENEKAREYLSDALQIFESIEDPKAKRVGEWLAELDKAD